MNKTNRNTVSCFSCYDIIGVPGTCLLLMQIQAVPMAPIVPARCYLMSLLLKSAFYWESFGYFVTVFLIYKIDIMLLSCFKWVRLS